MADRKLRPFANTRCCDNIQTSSVLPHCILQRQLGRECFSINLKRFLIEKRIKSLRMSWRHRIKFTPGNAPRIFCMDIDPVEQRYLLCGSCNGVLSIVDLELSSLSSEETAVEHPIIASTASHHSHKYLMTCCQWFPQDTGTFLSSSMDKTIKLWDTNRMKVVDKYDFKEEVLQFDWGGALQRRSLIAVANMSSNIELIDPRVGDAIQNLRWRTEYVSSVRWSIENENFLLSGGKMGKIALWDIRSAKSLLKTLSAPLENAHPTCVGGLRFSEDGLYLISISIDRLIRVWRAHNMELVRTIKLPSGLRDISLKNPTIRFDVFSEDGILKACIPDDEIIVVNIENNSRGSNNNGYIGDNLCNSNNCYDEMATRSILSGHLQAVNACLYRRSHQQIISSSNDRMVLVWTPAMDEVLSDELMRKLVNIRSDRWSDEEDGGE